MAVDIGPYLEAAKAFVAADNKDDLRNRHEVGRLMVELAKLRGNDLILFAQQLGVVVKPRNWQGRLYSEISVLNKIRDHLLERRRKPDIALEVSTDEKTG